MITKAVPARAHSRSFAIGVDYIDESEVLTPADNQYHVNKHLFKVPFVCGCRDLGEALRRIGEGAIAVSGENDSAGPSRNCVLRSGPNPKYGHSRARVTGAHRAAVTQAS